MCTVQIVSGVKPLGEILWPVKHAKNNFGTLHGWKKHLVETVQYKNHIKLSLVTLFERAALGLD